MKRTFLYSLVAVLLGAACEKVTNLPAYTPPVPVNFTVTSLNHTEDTVNVGDTIYLNATGAMYDTTKAIYAYLTVTYTVSGSSVTYTYGSAASPVKLSRTIGANASGLYGWTSTILLPGATNVPAKTKLSITGYFIYQLSFSSEQGNLTESDAGVKNKTVYVQ